jgi:hypothetical protein
VRNGGKMEIRNFCGIRFGNFAFKFDLNGFLKSVGSKASPVFAFKSLFFNFLKQQNTGSRG